MWELNGELSRDITHFDGMQLTFFGGVGEWLLRVEKEMVAIFLTFRLLRKVTKNVILVFYWQYCCTNMDHDN